MWKLKKIEAENLCAFRSLSYTLRQGVTTLIFGDNRDNESQRSNGAGKSALLECIAVGITGSPLRKIRSEEIINDASGECRIGLHFSNGNSAEELVVNRCIPRKGASTVSCTLFRNGAQVTTDEAVQPSVDAYNRYILEKLGITREELLNNFILSKYRYEDFLSSSDKEKKEIINRFSNGILVDEAIAILEEDIVPLSEKKQQAALELAGLDGRVEMLQEQIRKEEETGAERGRTRAGASPPWKRPSQPKGNRYASDTRRWPDMKHGLWRFSRRMRHCSCWNRGIRHWTSVWKRYGR